MLYDKDGNRMVIGDLVKFEGSVYRFENQLPTMMSLKGPKTGKMVQAHVSKVTFYRKAGFGEAAAVQGVHGTGTSEVEGGEGVEGSELNHEVNRDTTTGRFVKGGDSGGSEE